MTYPILDFDSGRAAMIEPSAIIRPLDEMPRRCVVCFFQDVIRDLVSTGRARQIAALRSEIGDHPIYRVELQDGREVGLIHPGIGAPLGAGLLEETIALGARAFIACGGAGVLRPELTLGHVVVPISAVRDEGTSYHYLPPGEDARPTPVALAAVERTLRDRGVPYVAGATWTTDAIFRETRAKVARRRDQGCLTVEMEAAAFFAVAAFRGVELAQILYGGDDLSGVAWDGRNWQDHSSSRELLFWLAAEAALAIEL